MLSSVGYHTIAISMNLTDDEADKLLIDFKRYRDRTNEIYIEGSKKYSVDPYGRHCEIKYLGQEKGIIWKIRFSNQGYLLNDRYITCSIKAIINPKILVGENSYIIAANADYLEKIEKTFNEEAKRISPRLKKFDDYSLNRLDYCINFDVSELNYNFGELKNKLPGMLMKLIKCGDIPNKFSEDYQEEFQFYLKSDAVVINCYWKYDDLARNFPKCDDLENSYNIIRFEVQYRYPKVREELLKIRNNFTDYRSKTISSLNMQALFEAQYNVHDYELTYRRSAALPTQIASDSMLKKMCMMSMMSDEKCIEVIKKYFNKTIRLGDYYTFEQARRKIEAMVPNWEKVTRLIDALELVRKSGGIAKAKASINGKELDDFRRSLRDLGELRINPVTIPEEWGIQFIQGLLNAYYNKLDREAEEERMRMHGTFRANDLFFVGK